MSKFAEVREQIQWAETRIELARSEITPYVQDHAFAFSEEVDAETGEHVRKVRLAKSVPVSIKGYLRNAIVDLKHSFDMSLQAAARTLGQNTFDRNFPWADSPSGVQGIIRAWQKNAKSRLPDLLIQEIWRQEPHRTGEGFSGGDDLIREIAKMANNKHSIGIIASAQIDSVSYANLRLDGGAKLLLGEGWDPEKKEMVLSRHIGPVSYENRAVTGNVFFESVGKLGPLPAIEASEAFCNRAKLCQKGFEAVVAGQAA